MVDIEEPNTENETETKSNFHVGINSQLHNSGSVVETAERGELASETATEATIANHDHINALELARDQPHNPASKPQAFQCPRPQQNVNFYSSFQNFQQLFQLQLRSRQIRNSHIPSPSMRTPLNLTSIPQDIIPAIAAFSTYCDFANLSSTCNAMNTVGREVFRHFFRHTFRCSREVFLAWVMGEHADARALCQLYLNSGVPLFTAIKSLHRNGNRTECYSDICKKMAEHTEMSQVRLDPFYIERYIENQVHSDTNRNNNNASSLFQDQLTFTEDKVLFWKNQNTGIPRNSSPALPTTAINIHQHLANQHVIFRQGLPQQQHDDLLNNINLPTQVRYVPLTIKLNVDFFDPRAQLADGSTLHMHVLDFEDTGTGISGGNRSQAVPNPFPSADASTHFDVYSFSFVGFTSANASNPQPNNNHLNNTNEIESTRQRLRDWHDLWIHYEIVLEGLLADYDLAAVERYLLVLWEKTFPKEISASVSVASVFDFERNLYIVWYFLMPVLWIILNISCVVMSMCYDGLGVLLMIMSFIVSIPFAVAMKLVFERICWYDICEKNLFLLPIFGQFLMYTKFN
mmetsp:Transcript_30599/g.62540  ORF Transcript_30599/g.62540 Transcript_30599/m.62540 type:complete len:575 (-) Transcript_30599:23-1747(-)